MSGPEFNPADEHQPTKEEWETHELRKALEMMYDRYENGVPVYELEDAEPTDEYLGNCVKITAQEEDEILLLIGGESTKQLILEKRNNGN
jgi:hypothetical protein